MADQRFKKQNILPAVSDDLMERIKALQDLYLVGGKPATVEFILDRAISLMHRDVAQQAAEAHADEVGHE